MMLKLVFIGSHRLYAFASWSMPRGGRDLSKRQERHPLPTLLSRLSQNREKMSSVFQSRFGLIHNSHPYIRNLSVTQGDPPLTPYSLESC